MSLPGFTADISLAPTIGHYRERALFASSGLVVPQLDSKYTYDETNADGSTTHVTITVLSAPDPDNPAGDPGGIFADGSSLGGGVSFRSVAQCLLDCSAIKESGRQGCATLTNSTKRGECFDRVQREYEACENRCTGRPALYGVGPYY